MNEQTIFAATCREYSTAIERIGRLETLPQGYWLEEYAYELEDLIKRRDVLRSQLKAMLEVQP